MTLAAQKGRFTSAPSRAFWAIGLSPPVASRTQGSASNKPVTQREVGGSSVGTPAQGEGWGEGAGVAGASTLQSEEAGAL